MERYMDMDESGCFFHALLSKGFAQKRKKNVKVEKSQSKE